MENVTKKRVRSFVLVVLLVGLAIMAAVVWFVFYRNKDYISNATAYVDGTIETDNSAVEKALADLYETEPAMLVQDQQTEKTRIGLLIVGLTEEDTVNEEVLRKLEEKNFEVTFALSAVEALEHEEFVTELKADGIQLVSNGLSGEANLQNDTVREQVSTMLRSRELISTSTDETIRLLYCTNTAITADVLRAAAVSGYSAVIDPEQANVIASSTFETQQQTQEYLASLQGSVVVVFYLRGEPTPLDDQPEVLPAKPVIDLQPDLEDEAEPQPEEPDTLEKLQWLLDGIEAADCQTEYVSRFAKTSGSAVLKAQAEDPDAELATIYHSCLTDTAKVGVGIKELPAAEELEQTLALLGEHHLTVTFFADAEQLSQRAADVKRLLDAGCHIGLTDVPTTGTRGEVYDALAQALEDSAAAGQRPGVYLTPESGDITSLRAAAKTLALKLVLPQNPAQPTAGALYLLDTLDEASLSALEQQAAAEGLGLADLTDLVEASGVIPTLSPTEVTQLRKNNASALAQTTNIVYTTERSVSFAFYGMENATVAQDAAQRLRSHGGTGTFFVTLNELMNSPRAVEAVLAQGHEIGISYKPNSDYPQTFEAVANYLNTWQKYAMWRYGVEATVVMLPSDDAAQETQEAVSASGCSLVRNTFLVVKNEDKEITLEQVDTALERISSMRVMRGSFVCFNMGFYTNDQTAQAGNTILGAVLDGFIEQHVDTLAYRAPITLEIEDESRFAIVPVSQMLASTQQYTFCLDQQTDVTMDKNVLSSLETDEERFAWIAAGYHGNITVDTKNKLPGFTSSEIRRLDKKGTFTDDKVIFLTFDDWGTEQSINELLYVLEKHEVKATFFIRTGYVDANPNLLRTIAVQGHQIASHTDNHVALADEVNTSGTIMKSLTEEEALLLRKDLVTSYNKLYKYTGDVVVDGKPALTRTFRPPTLAVSRIGLEQVFDVGFEYSVSGEYSTGDYEVTSYEEMLNRLKRRSIGGGKYITVHNGTVLVMHMQENAKYTAQALDTMIPLWKEQGYSFARIDDYLAS